MALIQNHFFSEALTECNSMDIIIPVETCTKEKYPVLWLIPPVGCDHTAWQRHTDVEKIAEENGIMIVMPDMKLSYGQNMVYGFDYHKMLTEELPAMIQDYFPADMERQMIVGVKEGAYTAMCAALENSEQFLAAAAFSCGDLMEENMEMMEERERKQLEYAFGTSDFVNPEMKPYHLNQRAECLGSGKLKVFVCYSEKDRYGKSAALLAGSLRRIMGDRLVEEIREEEMGWIDWEEKTEQIVKCFV